MDMFEIGQLLRTSRKAQHGASQASVGAPLGMSRATISGIENGTIPEIGIRKVMALCDALGFELVIRQKHARPTLQQLQAERDGNA
ncbi:MAG: helix-turn-helix domain-containing protein [Sterolibacterium sp.]|jgi:transcriptional regulator with XRE-family HTH domain|nr:helix-turn-helix domain-containing protein [Sterolibacterium sp.]